jgi:threonine dehydrogenase-like Zn-dependent dehydrogenase
VLGHEFAGEVVALGAGVTGIASGDRVAAIR